MVLTEVDSDKFRAMVRIANHRMNKNADFVNSLNVFPVPDGDTGTNMSLTIESGAQAVGQSSSKKVGDLTKAFSKGMLMGARGNSGVISSQLFRGFYKATQNDETLNAQQFADAFQNGVNAAYKAVMKPVEGTILTVAREGAQAGENKASTTNDVTAVMTAIVEAAKKALASTPDLLPVLKQVGVVDSGGQGLLFMYEGFLEALAGEKSSDSYQPDAAEMDEMVHAVHHQAVQSQLSTADIKNGYCTEIMVNLKADVPHKQPFDLTEFRNHLSQLGDSLLAVSDGEIAKVHVHTEHPGAVFNYGAEFGQLGKIKIDDMRIQHESIIDKDQNAEKPVEFAVIAVCSGNGIRKLFASLGVNRIISGGQTMNPSTQDIIDAIKKSGAKKAILLPNNGNIVLAAQQAAKVSKIPVGIVPSKTISQGLTAMLSFNPDDSVDDNVANMSAELSSVKSGEVTQAIRDSEINGVSIKKDDFLGIIDGDISVDQSDLVDCAAEMVDEMLDDDSEIITIMYGRDANKRAAKKLVKRLQAEHNDLEFEIHNGGQPVYYFLISVE